MSAAADDELVPVSAAGRVFGLEYRAGLGDCAPSGRIRLDAVARWLQDIAWADVADAEVEGEALWVLRRTRIVVNAFPQISQPYLLRTFAGGIGRMVAERRTVITTPQDPDTVLIDAVALWVHLRRDNRMPSGLSEREIAMFVKGIAAERQVGHRLRHPRPAPAQLAAAHEIAWEFRRVDMDVAEHVNNAAYWEPLEEELLRRSADITAIDAEVEFRDGAQPGAARFLRHGEDRWLFDGDGDLLASFRVLEP